jgi:hypothetical protein
MGLELGIGLEDVLTLVGFLVIGTGTIFAIRSNVTVLTTKVEETDKRNDERFMRIDAQLEDNKQQMRKLSEVVIHLTRTEGRMNTTDERILVQGKRIDNISKLLNEILMVKGGHPIES